MAINCKMPRDLIISHELRHLIFRCLMLCHKSCAEQIIGWTIRSFAVIWGGWKLNCAVQLFANIFSLVLIKNMDKQDIWIKNNNQSSMWWYADRKYWLGNFERVLYPYAWGSYGKPVVSRQIIIVTISFSIITAVTPLGVLSWDVRAREWFSRDMLAWWNF